MNYGDHNFIKKNTHKLSCESRLTLSSYRTRRASRAYRAKWNLGLSHWGTAWCTQR